MSVDRDEVLRAEEAASQAEADLQKVMGQRPEVDRLTESLSGHLKRNHFGERFTLEIRMRRASSP